MKITKTLPQFVNSTALLIVTGNLDAYFYIAQDGEINKVDSFLVEKPKYSDREDFGRRGDNVYESGVVKQRKKGLIERDFLAGLKASLKKVLGQFNVDSVYIFAPAPEVKTVKGVLPAKLQAKIKLTKSGNFVKEHVFEVLKKISK